MEREVKAELLSLLSSQSTPAERLQGLEQVGLGAFVISGVVGVQQQTVRSWRRDVHTPRNKHFKALDDLRFTAYLMIREDIEPEDVGNWLQSRSDEPPEYRRPIDYIVNEPQWVIAAAQKAINQK